MSGTVKKFLVGATMAAGVSAIAVAPAQATSLTLDRNSIQFEDFTTGTSTTNYRSYSGGSSGTFSSGNSTDAIKALTDNDVTSNVELGSDNTQLNSDHIGFTGTLGGHNVSVSGVTAADWQDFGSQWLDGFLNTYNGKGGITVSGNNVTVSGIPFLGSITQTKTDLLNSLISAGGLPSSGDPNIGSLTLDDTTGQFQLSLVGFNDLTVPYLDPTKAAHYTTGNPLWDTLLKTEARNFSKSNLPLQASEIAKVTIDGQTKYAYSFAATQSGITASDDHTSYSGIYKWTTTVPTAPKSVPEPSVLLGLIGVAGIFATKRKLLRKA